MCNSHRSVSHLLLDRLLRMLKLWAGLVRVTRSRTHSLSARVRYRLAKRSHHRTRFFQCAFELLIGILLHRLGVLELLDQLHLELLHLHDFFFLLLAKVVLVVHPIVVLALDLLQAPLSVFFDLHCSQPLLLVHDLILHAVFLLDLEALELLFLLVLLLDDLGLLGFFAARLKDGLLHFALLVSSLLLNREVLLGHHSLILVLHLVVVDFLK